MTNNPQLTANDPSLGYISWSAFNIDFKDVTYSINAGNTNRKWVWWRKDLISSSDDVLGINVGDVLPQDLTDNDYILFLNKSGTPIRIYASSLIDGDLLINGSVTTKALAADSITTQLLRANRAVVEALFSETITGVNVVSSNFETTSEIDRGVKITTATVNEAGEEEGVTGIRAWITKHIDPQQIGKRFFAVLPDVGVSIAEGLMTLSKLTVKADSDSNVTSTSLGGLTSLPTGGKAVMQASTQPPNAPPGVDSEHETKQFTNDGFWSQRRGWSKDHTYWYTTRPIARSQGGFDTLVERWSANGTLHASATTYGPARGFAAVSSVVAGGNLYYTDRYDIRFVPANFVNGQTFQSTGHTFIYNEQAKGNALGYDPVGNVLLLAHGNFLWSDDEYYLVVERINLHSNPGSRTTIRGLRVNADLAGVCLSSDALWTGNRFAFARRDGQMYVRQTDLIGSSADQWPLDVSGCVGFTKVADDFVSMDTSGLMRTYSRFNEEKLWVSSTFARGGSVSQAPEYETTQSPRAEIILSKRARIRVTPAAVPESESITAPDRFRIFVGSGATDPGRVAMKCVQAPPATTLASSYSINHTLPGSPPPAQSTFADGVPYVWQAEVGGAWLDGNSDGNIGTGTYRDSVRASSRITGEIQMYAGSIAPPEWLLCNGQSLSRTAYSALFAVIGTSFGSASGSTFNVPDLTRRVPIGSGGGVNVGRNEGIVTQSSRTFAHDHGITASGEHNHSVNTVTGGSFGSGNGSRNNVSSTQMGGNHNHGGVTADSVFDDMPHLVVNFIIKT